MLGQQGDHIAAMTPRQSLPQTHVVTSSLSNTRTMDHDDSNLTRQGDACHPPPVRGDKSGSVLLLSEIACTGLPAFPFRLHDMLNDAEAKGFDHIVSWQIDGRSFKVHDKDQFSSEILPRYFQGQTRYKSFQRQLNIYGFSRILAGSYREKGGYTHDLLERGKPMMCRLMIRTKVKNKGSRSSSSDSLVRMKGEQPSLEMSRQNSSFPLQRSSAPDFGLLTNALSTSSFVFPSSPSYMNNNATYQNERFTPITTQIDRPRSLFKVEDEGGPSWLGATEKFSSQKDIMMKTCLLQSRLARLETKTPDTFNNMTRNSIRAASNQLNHLLPISNMMEDNQEVAHEEFLLGSSFGRQDLEIQNPVRMLDEMDDSDLESLFNDCDLSDPTISDTPFEAFSISEGRSTHLSQINGDSVAIDGPSSSSSLCPVAAELVRVFHHL